MSNSSKIERIRFLVEYLSKCADEYYNTSSPTISDAQYDALFDELSALEKETGVILATSPTQRVGYEVISELQKVTHPIPLLSLAKTKDAEDIAKMLESGDGYLALKIDGLTVELLYEDGILREASTRGDGIIGELITHNARVFADIPLSVNHKGLLRITGEAHINIATFEQINDKIDNDEEKYSTPRNLAAGSVRQLDSAICKERNVHFMPFNVLEGMEDTLSRSSRMDTLANYGFARIPSIMLKSNSSVFDIENAIYSLKEQAEQLNLPIDGIVFFYDDAVFSASLGRTSHHFRDGIAYKFGDPHFKTTLKDIHWNISRTGQLTPIAIFDEVEIDNTVVERASLHNMTFVKDLKLLKGDKILVSKRNMIIPHVEENLSGNGRKLYILDYPHLCPVCKCETSVSTTNNNNRTVEVLYCKNNNCPGKKTKKFTHFVSKQALNIDGLSEQTIEKFLEKGWLKNLKDIFELYTKKDEIVKMEGFGKKSYENIIKAINDAKNTTLTNLIVAMNIDLIGKSGAALIEERFSSDAKEFLNAVDSEFDFTEIEGFGEIMNNSLHSWFKCNENRAEFISLLSVLNIKATPKAVSKDSRFFGKKIVITGSFSSFSRDELSDKLTSLGAKVSGSVSSKTDYVFCGEKPGSKLSKAQQLGVTVLFENDFIDDI